MPPPTSRAEHLTRFPHWCRCGKHIPVSRWAVSDWHVFLLLPSIYSRFIQRDIPCQRRCLLCLTWYLPAPQQRHVCCRTPFLTGDTSAWRMWPIILLYASANSTARQDMDKILIYSKKGNSCVAPAASPSTSLRLRCCLSSLPCRHPTHILLSRTARRVANKAQDWQGFFCAPVKEPNVCPGFALQEGNIFCGNPPALMD